MMNREQIAQSLRPLFERTFQVDPVVALTLGTPAEPATIASWDSLGHLRLVLAIEQRFGLTIAPDAVPQLGHFTKIVDYLESRAVVTRGSTGSIEVSGARPRASGALDADASEAVEPSEPSRLAPYARFAQEMTRLNVWYVHRLFWTGQIAERDLRLALTSRVDIYRMTTLWDGLHDPKFGHVDPQWERISNLLAERIASTPAQASADVEAEGLRIVRPWLEVTDPDRRFPMHARPRPPRPFGCWTYSLEWWEGIADREGWLSKLRDGGRIAQRMRKALGMRPVAPRHASVHFENVMKPLSVLDDLPSLAQSLLALLHECRRTQPTVRQIWCESWLNSVPSFVALFPPEWLADPRVPGPTNYPSLWGQFMTATGDFNDVVGKRFRESGGEFPYRSLRCHAPIELVQAHLTELCSRQALLPQD